LFNNGFLNLPVFIKKFKCFLFVLTHQRRVPDNIGEHNSGKLAGLCHVFPLIFIEVLAKKVNDFQFQVVQNK